MSNIEIKNIKPFHIQKFIHEKIDNNLSQGYIKNLIITLNQAFVYGIKILQIIKSNPCENVKISKTTKIEDDT